jgi:hypothetical protein
VPRVLWVALPLVVSLTPLPAASQEPPPGAPEGPMAAPLPSELPPFDEGLFDLLTGEGDAERFPFAARGLELFGDGRLRLELDENRDMLPPGDLQAGVSLTGRLGVRAPLGPHSATVVLGDGRRLGQDAGNLPVPLVRPPPLSFLYALHVDLDASALFLPATLRIGRMPVEVGDGRWLGRADFDPRGRTFEGALLLHEGSTFAAKAGALWLGPMQPGDAAAPSFVLLGEGRRRGRSYEASAYGLLHRDGTPAAAALPALSIATLGARGEARALGLQLKMGADGQLPLTDERPLEPVGFGAHLEAALRYAPELSLFSLSGAPFIELSSEWTGGEAYRGRAFRAPGGSPHGFLGVLDLAEADNMLSAALALGLQTKAGFLAAVELRLLALSDPRGALYDAAGKEVLAKDSARDERLAFTEVDARVRLPCSEGASLEAEYGVAFGGPALQRGASPVQRLLLSAVFSFDPAP